ncbi:hypothetical protein NS44R_15180, partial [Mammaliicoccus sciuri]
ALARRKGRQQRCRDAEGICRRDPRASRAPLHLEGSGCGGGVGPGSGSRLEPIASGGEQARSFAGQGARQAPRLRDRRHRPAGDGRAQQRQHDREDQPRHDRRVRTGRDLHRTGVPLGRGDVLLHPAGHLPRGAVRHRVVAARGGAAIRKRGGTDRVVRPWAQRNHPLP